jgi:hypothetical protein
VGVLTGLAAIVAAALIPGAVAPAHAATWAGAAPRAHAAAHLTARAGVISTVVGGTGGPAAGRRVATAHPCGVAAAGRTVYATEPAGNLLRSLSTSTGMLATVAGTGTTGLDSLGTAKTALNGPCGTAVDKAGNVLLASSRGNVVLAVAARTGTFYGIAMRAGHRYVVAGGSSATGTPATQAALGNPPTVAVDRHGNLLVPSGTSYQPSGEEPGPGSAILQVVAGAAGTFYGQQMVPGGIYPVAGAGCPGAADAGCPAGFGGDGGPAASAAFGTSLAAVAVDPAGNVLLTDTGNGRVRVIAAATGTFYGQAMTAGDVYTIAGGGSSLGDGGPGPQALLQSPAGLAVDRHGNVLISDTGAQRVRLLAAANGTFYGHAASSGDIYTIAGNGTAGFTGDKGRATSAELHGPLGLGLDRGGNAVIADSANNRLRVVAAAAGTWYQQRMTAGRIYTVAGNGATSYSGDGGRAVRGQLSPFAGVLSDGSGGDQVDPGSLAVSRAGSIAVSDSANNRVRVVPARDGSYFGRKMTAGHIYTIAGTGARGSAGDGGPGGKARLAAPVGVAVDSAGNVLVADSGNERVRVVCVKAGRFYGRRMTAGHIYPLAGGGTSTANGIPAGQAVLDPLGLAVDGHGNVVIASFTALRVVAARAGTFYGQAMKAGRIYTVGGMAAGQPDFLDPGAVAVDRTGNLVVADDLASVVQVLAVKTGRFYGRRMTAGHYYTVAGSFPATGLSGDGGPAVKARLDHPGAVAVDGAGNVLIADTVNARVRVVAEHNGSFYGKRMTAGDIYTVAGSGPVYPDGDFGGFSGDGGPAVKAVLFGPCGVAARGGGLLVLDSRNNRVRAVAG